MKPKSRLALAASFGLILLLAGVLFAQSVSNRALVVNGKQVDAPLVQFEGHSYTYIQALAAALNGSLIFEPNRVVLTLPGPDSTSSSGDSTAHEVPPLSRDFARAAIAEIAGLREWRGVITTIITYGLPVVGTWPQDYHDRVEADLMQTQVAAVNESDQKAVQLIENQFANTEAWSSDVVSERQALNAARSVDPNALQNDILLTKITNCGRFLSNMIVSGLFSDDMSCH
jgi:hypothetical protein